MRLARTDHGPLGRRSYRLCSTRWLALGLEIQEVVIFGWHWLGCWPSMPSTDHLEPQAMPLSYKQVQGRALIIEQVQVRGSIYHTNENP